MLRTYDERYAFGKNPPASRRAAAIEFHEFVPTVLYAARFPDGTIKFGCTGRIDVRLSHLRDVNDEPGELLAIKVGDFDDEARLHESLSAHVAHGREWYRPTAEVLAVVNQWRAAHHYPPLCADPG